jgi:hypothetical protein
MSDDLQTADDEPRVSLTVNLPPNAVALMPGIADNPTIVLDLTPSQAELIALTPAQREQRFCETLERLKQFSDESLLAKNLAVSTEILKSIRAQQAQATALAPPIETPPRLTVNLGRRTVTLDGQTFDVDSDQAVRWLKVLSDHPGDWLSPVEVAEYDPELDGTRLDRLKKFLPPSVLNLIDSKTGRGSRLRLA